MPELLAVHQLTVQHGSHTLLDIDHWQLPEQQFTAVIGPNGAGKSTLLNALAGGTPLDAHIRHRGTPLARVPARELARQRAVLGQHPALAFPYPVADLVQLGREAWRGTREQAHDAAVCAWAMEATETAHLARRNAQQLSGGEQHRVHLARVLAQLLPSPDADLCGKWLLLDEPTNHLDIRHQYRLFATLAELQTRGLTLLAILHDPALALNHADRLLLLKNARIQGEHSPQDTVRGQHLDTLYDIPMHPRRCPESHRYHLSPQLPA
ncbi:MAG: ATP-binding cassette domain-containing protein [Cardiobacteriaceae bacterium]|nr:ATP-binding cassette domain-containing protein [Cardiobacteriaceae bacterium]